jgi:hypothetical protein
MKFRRDDTQEIMWSDWLKDDEPADSHREKADQLAALPKLSDLLAKQRHASSPQDSKPGPRDAKPGLMYKKRQADTATTMPRALNVSLTIGMPDFRQLQGRIKRLPWKRIVRVATIGIAVIALLAVSNAWLQGRHRAADHAVNASTPTYAPLQSQTPARQHATEPAHYDSQKQLYLFHDNYHGVAITVSQQPMPASVQPGKNKLADIAQSIGATEKIETIHDDVFYTKPDTSGAQRLVFTNGQTLVFITSQGSLSNKEWVDYVQNLE